MKKISDTGEGERTYELKDGRFIIVKIDEVLDRVEVFDPNKDQIGEITFECYDDGAVHKIMRMGLEMLGEGYKHCGIGRECLKFYKEWMDVALIAGEDTGESSDDGSHLIGDGVPFISQMRAEGIVV